MKKDQKVTKHQTILYTLCGAFCGVVGVNAWQTQSTEIVCDSTSYSSVSLYVENKFYPDSRELLAKANKEQLLTGMAANGKTEATVALNTASHLLAEAQSIGILQISNLDQPDKSKISCQLIFAQRNEWVQGIEKVIESTMSRFP